MANAPDKPSPTPRFAAPAAALAAPQPPAVYHPLGTPTIPTRNPNRPFPPSLVHQPASATNHPAFRAIGSPDPNALHHISAAPRRAPPPPPQLADHPALRAHPVASGAGQAGVPAPPVYRPSGAAAPDASAARRTGVNVGAVRRRYRPQRVPRCRKVRLDGRECGNVVMGGREYCFAHGVGGGVVGGDGSDGGVVIVGGRKRCERLGCAGGVVGESAYCQDHQWLLRRLRGLNG
ncbi:uncharacterized protein BKCO1_25000102 [Diplodia corticola]|uniref:Uncharacterized protein n=1 Tax=Diplodia corticola TaxID=236234 RepID=A0A1J9QYG1_9PEZI|nr:uncharacterized protein BKCO1_25000102 [Diplodia corticola]OJD34086.1 hypothetical protein BKCO1_25000102 [Diplodia corticola]